MSEGDCSGPGGFSMHKYTSNRDVRVGGGDVLLVIESPVRSSYLPFWALTKTLTGHTKSQISN